MPTPILRNFYGNEATQAPTTQDVRSNQLLLARNQGNEMTRGFGGGLSGALANASEFVGATLSQYGVDPGGSYELANKYREEAQNLSPAIEDYRGVHDLRTFSQYAGNRIGQGVGSTLPAMAGAVVAKNPYLGAYAGAFPIEAGETLGTFRTDPQYANVSKDRQYKLALEKGGINAALEAIVPGSPVKPMKLIPSLAEKMAIEGGTEGIQEQVGQRTLSMANPNRDTSGDLTSTNEAIFSGGLGGAGLGAPGAIKDSLSHSAQSGTSIFETAKDKARALGSKADFGSIFTSSGDRAATILSGDENLTGKSLQDTEQNILNAEQSKVNVTADLAKSLNLNGDPSDSEFQTQVAVAHMGQVMSQKARSIYDELKSTANKISKAVPGVKKSEMHEDQGDIEKLVFDHLTKQAASNPEIRDRISHISSYLADFVRKSDDLSGRELRQVVSTLKNTQDLFTDPVALFQELGTHLGAKQNLFEQASKMSSAEKDAGNENSYLYHNLADTALGKVTMPQMKAVGRFIDEYATLDISAKQHEQIVTRLANELFGGSVQRTKAVLNYYAKQNHDDLQIPVFGDAPEEKLTPAPEPGKDLIYREPAKQRPYRAFSRDDYRAIVSEARNLRQQSTGSASVRFRTEADLLANSSEETQRERARSIYRDVADRYKEELKQRGPDTPNATNLRLELNNLRQLAEAKEPLVVGKRTFEPGHKGILQSYGVFETSQANKNELQATDEDLSKMRTLVDKGTRETASDISKTFITFERTKGGPIRLSAESMWKTIWEKNGKGFGESPRKLFYDSVAAVMARGDISGMRIPGFTAEKLNSMSEARRREVTNNYLRGLVVDRATNRKALRSEFSEAIGKELSSDEALNKLNDKTESAVEEYMDADPDRQKEIEGNIEETYYKYQHKLDIFEGKAMDRARLQKTVEILKNGLQEISAEKFQSEVDERGYLTDPASAYRQDATSKPETTIPNQLPTKPNKPISQEKEHNIAQDMDLLAAKKARAAPSGVVEQAPKEPKKLVLTKYMADNQTENHSRIITSKRLPGFFKGAVFTIEGQEGQHQVTDITESIRNDLKEVITHFKPIDDKSAKHSMYAEPSSTGKGLTEAEKEQIKNYIVKVRGDKIKVIFDKLLGDAAGAITTDKRTGEKLIYIASKGFEHGLSTAYHESMHDFFDTLLTSPTHRRIAGQLLEAAESPAVIAQLKTLLKDHPGALRQIESSAEERLAYMYQFWAAGALTIGPQTKNWFTKVTDFFRQMLGVLSQDKKIEKILQALHEGELTEPSTVAEVLYDRGIITLNDKLHNAAGPLIQAANKLSATATDRLKQTNIPSLSELADKFAQDPGKEHGGLGFLQKRSQQSGKFVNQLQKIFKETTVSERSQALHNLQAMKAPSNPVEHAVRDFLEEMHAYMKEAGVTNVFDKKDLGYVEKYFPRIWDPGAIARDKDGFIRLLKQEGKLSDSEIREFLDKVIKDPDREPFNEGVEEIAPNAASFTPYAPSVRGRVFTFINENNAELFTKFQEKDIIQTLSAYTFQSVHRGEFARFFGNSGEVINAALLKAREQGATSAEIDTAVKAVAAMEGTLGNKLSPQMRNFMMGVMSYENIVLLPFALYSSLIDPLGVAVRTGDMKEAWNALKEGAKGIVHAIKGTKEQDEGYQLAKMLGIIDEQNLLESMGRVYSSVYMSKNLKKLNTAFFRWNGMQMWTERMRIAGVYAAQRFIAKNIDNERYMTELGLEKSDVKVLKNQDGVVELEMTPKVQEAIFKFVDSAVLRPNAAQRPIWGSDPRFMLLFHLKQYTFSFNKVIMGRAREELKYGKAMPVWILASYVPFMLAVDLLKGSMTGTKHVAWTASDYLISALDKSGVLGLGTFGLHAAHDVSSGRIPGSSLVGPTLEHVLTGVRTVAGAPGADYGQLVYRSIPAGPLVKAVVQ